jgi:hypothetical protein
VRLPVLSKEQLISFGISERLSHLVTSHDHPIPKLDLFVEPIDPDWDHGVPSDAGDVVGLWQSNADPRVRWCRRGVVEFARLHHDDDQPLLIAWTEQGLLADLVRQYYENIDWPSDPLIPEAVKGLAGYVGFRHLAALIEFLERNRGNLRFHDDFREQFGRLP